VAKELDNLARFDPAASERRPEDLEALCPSEDIIEEARNGRMFILVDDEDRENEGDLCIPAQMATPEAINFMARFGRGLICLALTGERIKQLGIPMMPRASRSRQTTAFTVSIEAREGITTGISAPDRARTIAVAIDTSKGPEDIVTPGHIFPLEARDGGVLVRTGHTEASVDIARLAGLNASAVICEIMNDDGTMARLPDLVKFARHHGLKIGSIADLIAYRRRYDRLVEKMVESHLDSQYGGDFRLIVYRSKVNQAEHIALVKGNLDGPEPVLVRMHAVNIIEDVLGDRAHDRGGELHRAMRAIGAAGRGVIVIIRESRLSSVSDRIKKDQKDGFQPDSRELRDYGMGAQILLDLGVRDMVLLSNTPRTIVGLDGYGLRVIEQRPIPH
jgi:3,4-dihydroxy 2-butanone 4-phosphate synthase/GTP cyclohydrolase II